MTQPQSGVLPPANPHAIFLTLLVGEESEAVSAVRRAAAVLHDLTAAVAAKDSGGTLYSTIGFGADIWDRLYPGNRPPELAPFKALSDGTRVAPSTPADLFLHVRGDRLDLGFELAREMRKKLGNAVQTVEEIHGFRYLDSRDLTGFVDGTENPQEPDHRARVALVPDDGTPFANGSHVTIQRYIRDLAAWEELSVAEQEQVFARTKADDIEFDSERKPPTAHIVRASLKDNGEPVEILRHSMPYGTADTAL